MVFFLKQVTTATMETAKSSDMIVDVGSSGTVGEGDRVSWVIAVDCIVALDEGESVNDDVGCCVGVGGVGIGVIVDCGVLVGAADGVVGVGVVVCDRWQLVL